mmetsp:Transcript_55721/g.91794  ORF Transcript_55721/g.91794 Transcript_55721/m.91794 type:complete len:80 (-) Transcript_55721:156-395(-)
MVEGTKKEGTTISCGKWVGHQVVICRGVLLHPRAPCPWTWLRVGLCVPIQILVVLHGGTLSEVNTCPPFPSLIESLERI